VSENFKGGKPKGKLCEVFEIYLLKQKNIFWFDPDFLVKLNSKKYIDGQVL
jgi:hypothetical protein